MLYVPDTVLACRLCHRLYYATQRLGSLDRLERRANKLLARLGASPGDEVVRRPKGMHERTYDRILTEALACRRAAWDLGVQSILRHTPFATPVR